jgi:hypothetical protein
MRDRSVRCRGESDSVRSGCAHSRAQVRESQSQISVDTADRDLKLIAAALESRMDPTATRALAWGIACVPRTRSYEHEYPEVANGRSYASSNHHDPPCPMEHLPSKSRVSLPDERATSSTPRALDVDALDRPGSSAVKGVPLTPPDSWARPPRALGPYRRFDRQASPVWIQARPPDSPTPRLLRPQPPSARRRPGRQARRLDHAA